MKKLLLACGVVALLGGVSGANAQNAANPPGPNSDWDGPHYHGGYGRDNMDGRYDGRPNSYGGYAGGQPGRTWNGAPEAPGPSL